MGDAHVKAEVLSGVDLTPIDALKALKHEGDMLRSRRASMEALRSDFAEAVYRRVDGDYARQLDAIEQKSEPLRQQALAAYAGLRSAVREIDAAHEAVKLDRQEIDLRHKLGELDVAERDRRIAGIESALTESHAAHERAQALRARFAEVFDEADLDRPAVAQTQPRPVPVAIERAREAARPVIEPASTRVMPILDLPEPPKVPVAVKAPAPPVPPPASVAGAASTMFLRTARLVPQSPEAGRAAIPLPPRPVTLGNDDGAEIQVGGPGVEPKHAEININAKGYTLVDLGSKQGTLVNAEPVQERLLRHEDVIQIGAARYVFREG
jgi:hypothetical protein